MFICIYSDISIPCSDGYNETVVSADIDSLNGNLTQSVNYLIMYFLLHLNYFRNIQPAPQIAKSEKVDSQDNVSVGSGSNQSAIIYQLPEDETVIHI